MPVNKNEVTKEMLEKAVKCKTTDELIALAKTAGIELTEEEAKAYLAELADLELDEVQLREFAGGAGCYGVDNCALKCGTIKA